MGLDQVGKEEVSKYCDMVVKKSVNFVGTALWFERLNQVIDIGIPDRKVYSIKVGKFQFQPINHIISSGVK